jgi:hypothetical protein
LLPYISALLFAVASASAPAMPSTLTLRNGSYFDLPEPARKVGNRFVFRTTAGKTYSIESSEVLSTGPAPRSTPVPRRMSTHDSRALGAIVRAERNRKGKAVEIAPQPARPAKRAKKTRAAKAG